MKLTKIVNIDNWFSRSINLERDGSSVDAVTAYVPTSTTLKTLKSIANGFTNDKHHRAWTLIGPYGSGKSSFAIFLNALTQPKDSKLFQHAAKKLELLDKGLAKKFMLTASQGGALNIMLTGSYASLEIELFNAIEASLTKLKFTKKYQTKIDELLKSAGNNPGPNDVISLVKLVQASIVESQSPCSGIIIAIDELGKFVEYAGKNQGDIYLLQSLAELSVTASKAPIFFIGMLHQTLDFYAKELDAQTKNEWRKIQGRFEEITFVESIEQTIRIISRAIIQTFSKSQTADLKRVIKQPVQGVLDSKIFPNLLKIRESVEFFHAAYPLHPVTAILLPILAQKLGQNERTVFTYLGSSEQYGFQAQIAELNYPDSILPAALFDYFVTNQASYIYDHYTHKRWLEVLDAIDRLGDADVSVVKTLKTIGLLNIVGSSSNLRCSKEFLEIIFEKKELTKSLSLLEKKSIITYRSFNNEYRVWQGSDFDFEQSLSHELAQLESFDLAHELNSLMPPLPLVAKRYSVTSGTLRTIPSQYLAESMLISGLDVDQSTPQAFLLLKNSQKLKPAALKIIKDLPENIIVLDVSSDLGIEIQTKELKALRVIYSTYDEIQADPIAKKELSDQIDHRQTSITATLKKLMNPRFSSWYWKGEKLKIQSNVEAQAKLSWILESIYSKSPVIRNELVNRDQVSGQGQSARIKLMKDMLNKREILNLDYPDDKFPPEKTIFNAIFIENNLYKFNENQGSFEEPATGQNLYAVYAHLKELLLKAKEPVSFQDIQESLSAIPFGLKKGVQPVIFMGFYLANENNLAVYEDGIFRPYINNESIDRLVRKTEAFSFQMHAFEGQQSIISQYAESLFGGESKELNVLNIVKKLSRVMKGLPEYVLNTRSNLSKEAIKFRASFQLSKSPQDLLLKDIPIALGYKPDDLKSQSKIAAFSNDLNKTLTELNKCYEELLKDQKVKFNLAFELDSKYNLNQLRTSLRTKYLALRDYSVDSLTLKPFLTKMLDEDIEDQFWFEGLLSFLVKKHPHKWQDETISEAEVELRNISDRMKDIAKLQVYEAEKGTTTSKDIDVFVMRLKKKGEDELDVITTLSKEEKAQYNKFKLEILKVLDEYSSNNEERLTYLAPLLDEILQDKIDAKGKLKAVKKDKD